LLEPVMFLRNERHCGLSIPRSICVPISTSNSQMSPIPRGSCFASALGRAVSAVYHRADFSSSSSISDRAR
jgi:hypothetical protein